MAESFEEIKKEITNSLEYKMAKKKVLIYQKKFESTKAKNYGSIDLEYNYIRFFNTPELKINALTPVITPTGITYKEVSTTLPMSDKNHFILELKYSYPIFSGFAITNLIEKSKLELIKQKLLLKNLKKVLILKAAKIYSDIYALNCNLKALNSSKKAILSLKEKAFSMYRAGLINKAEVKEIEAKYYEIESEIKLANAKKDALLHELNTLLNKKINSIDSIEIKRFKFTPHFQNREDLKAIKQSLKISEVLIKLAKSKYYPQIGFSIALKKEADNLTLTRNDYQNIDKSFMFLGVKYNIFDGGEKKKNLEISKIYKANAVLFYQNYLNKIKTEFNNDLSFYNALFSRLDAAKKEVEAREEFFEYIKAKFKEGLADSSELNRALSKLLLSKAKRDMIKSQIFFYNEKLKYESGR